MRIICTLFFIFMISVHALYSQREFTNWYFSDSSAITFNTADGVPAPLNNCNMSNFFDCISVSDAAGNLLFYSDGKTIWNREYNKMLNGDVCMPDNDKFSVIVIPKPKDNSKYYIFSTPTCVFNTIPNGTLILYTEVDMKQDNGLGAVIKSDTLFKNMPNMFVTHELEAVKHANGTDYWLITHSLNNLLLYNAILITEEGITENNTVVSSDVGIIKYVEVISQLIASPDGTKLVSPKPTVWNRPDIEPGLEFFKFDRNTGKLYDRLLLTAINTGATNEVLLGTGDFSPDGLKYYIVLNLSANGEAKSDKRHMALLQYDLSKWILKYIWDSKTEIATGKDLQRCRLGPDGKIYVDQKCWECKSSFINVIENPNAKGLACNYVPQKIKLDRGCAWKYFPRKIGDYFSVKIESIGMCEGGRVVLRGKSNTISKNVSYLWNGPNGFASTDSVIVIENVKNNNIGPYILYASADGFSARDSIYLTVHPKPRVELNIGKKYLCEGETVTIKTEDTDNILSYSWSTGETTSEIMVSKPGKYILTATSAFGCQSSDTAEIFINPFPQANIVGAGTICEGDSIVLSSEFYENDYKYLWSTGERTMWIKIHEAGQYTLRVENGNGCVAYDTAIVSLVSSINPVIKSSSGQMSLCRGGYVVLSVEPKENEYIYKWSTGETTPDIEVRNEGLYTVSISPGGNCEDTTSVYVKLYDKPAFSIEGPESICKGSEAVLTTNKEFATYLWSTGETSRTIKISNGGMYEVKVTDINGCSGNASWKVKELAASLSVPPEKDLGLCCTGESISGEIELINEGDEAIHIKEITFEGNQQLFKALPINMDIAKYESRLVEIQFSSPNVGEYFSTVKLLVDAPCQKEYIAGIKAAAYTKTNSSLPDIISSIGDNISIPLQVIAACGEDLPANAEYTAEVRMEASLLLPDNVQDSGVTDKGIKYGERIFEIKGSGQKNIKGTIMLALNDENILSLDLKWDNPFIENESKNGSLKIAGVCVKNLSKIRFINKYLMTLSPNPASDESELRIEGEDNGIVSIEVYNMQGNRIMHDIIEKQSTNAVITLDLKHFSDGIYKVVAQTASGSVHATLVIVK